MSSMEEESKSICDTNEVSEVNALSNVNPTDVHKDDIVLIWFRSTTEVDNIQDDLQAVQTCVVFIDDIDACITEIKSRKEKLFLIISGINAYALLPHVNQKPQLDSIFIYPAVSKDYQRLRGDYPKVQGIFDDSKHLIKSIRENIRMVNRQMEVNLFYDQYQRGTRDLEEQSTEFLWFRLFKDVIEHLPHDEKAKTEMLSTCRQYYRDKPRILRDIDEFEMSYDVDDCIRWYTKETFVYQLLNKALRTEDIEQLYIFRYYVSDLSKQLAEKYQLMKNQPEKRFRLYRGAPTLKAEYGKLQANIGKTSAVNSYWSTSRSRARALQFAKSSVHRNNVVAVLYEIECSLENNSAIFADIMGSSDFDSEEEILFDAGSVFQIENIQEELDDGVNVCIIRIKTIEEDKKLEEEHRDRNRRQMKEEGPQIMLSTLLKRMGNFEKSLEFLYYLLKNPDGKNLAYIHNRIGIALKDFNKDNEALTHLKTAFQMTYYSNPPDKRYSAFVLHNQGLVYAKKKEYYGKASEFYRRAISIFKDVVGESDPDIAQFYNSIGRLYYYQEDFSQAIKYQWKAKEIRELLTPNYVMNAFVYTDIGNIYLKQEYYDQALEYHLKALELREKNLPKNHYRTAESLHQVGKIYSYLNRLPAARRSYQNSLHIFQNYSKTNLCWNIPKILEDLASTHQGNSQQALDYRLRALDARKKYLPHDEINLAKLLDDIAFTYKSMKQKQDALNYYHQALEVCEKFMPPDDFKLSYSFRHLACLYEETGDKTNALRFYTKLLNIYELYHSPNYYLCQNLRKHIQHMR